ncbi:MAG: tetratricopeptide repeat protein [Acidobacteriota bacterium]
MKSVLPIVRVAWVALVSFVAFSRIPAQELEGRREARGAVLVGSIQLPPGIANYPGSIRVTVQAGNYHQTTTVTPGGTFVFTGVPTGDMIVEVQSPGFDTTRTLIHVWSGSNDVAVPLGEAVHDRNDLARPPSPTVSLRVLKIPEKAKKLAARAQEQSDKEHFEEAVRWLREAVKVCPDYVEAWNNLGVTYMRMGLENQAESALLKAVERDAGSAPALRNLGFLYLHTGRPREALPVLLRARQTQEAKDFYTETYIGNALYGTGQYQEAAAVLEQAIKMKGDFPAALFPLGLAQVRLHQYEAARRTFERFLQISDKGKDVDVARSILAQLNDRLGAEERKPAE